MDILLSDILEDKRLIRLFGVPNNQCALQLWLLQIKKDELVESRLLYGRALPYDFSNNKWSVTRDDNFVKYNGFQAQVICLNLYCTSSTLLEVTKNITEGNDLTTINNKNVLSFSHKEDSKRFGAFCLNNDLSFRPVSYLPMRSDWFATGLRSVHESAGAFSASITNLQKNSIFKIDDINDEKLIKNCIKELHSKTGLDFLDNDSDRIGDLEFLVFPTLDEKERNLFYINWDKKGSVISINLEQSKDQLFDDFQFNITLVNGDSNIYSVFINQSYKIGSKLEFEHTIPAFLNEIIDGVKVDVFAKNTKDDYFFLYSQYGVSYIREISLNTQLASVSGKVSNSWLLKHANENDQGNIKKLETIQQKSIDVKSLIGGRKNDPWIAVNKLIKNNFENLIETKSEGEFFEQWEEGKGSGRIKFSEWFRKVIHANDSGSVYIFDPYFEDAGIYLLSLSASVNTEYVVFTTREKQKKTEKNSFFWNVINKIYDFFVETQNKPLWSERINSLLEACEKLKPLLMRVKLKIYALPPNVGKRPAFHDRYILTLDSNGKPVKGFHLSNSIQKANESYPLLITPIPKNTLEKVLVYASSILENTKINNDDEDIEFVDNRNNLIFDSRKYYSQLKDKTRYEPLAIFENKFSGDLLSEWLCEPSLKGKHSENLKEKLTSLDCLQGESFKGAKYNSLGNLEGFLRCCTPEDFKRYWFVAGSLFAHTSMGDSEKIYKELASKTIIKRLSEYILQHDDSISDAETGGVDFSALYSKNIDSLLIELRGSYDFLERGIARLDWALFYAIKIIWKADCTLTLNLLCEHINSVIDDSVEHKKLICAQLISEIALDIEFGINNIQIFELIRQPVAILKWLGFCGLENEMANTQNISLLALSNFPKKKDKIKFLCWAVNRSSNEMSGEQSDINKIYITELLNTIPHQLTLNEFRELVQALEGRMQQLGWCEPWMYEYIITPLLNTNRVDIDYVCEVWMDELISNLSLFINNKNIFSLKTEGQMTNFSALYLANSSAKLFDSKIKKLKKLLTNAERYIQAPLSSTKNWSEWDSALKVALWIYGFTKWVEYFLKRPYKLSNDFNELKLSSHRLAMYRQKDEWASMTTAGNEFGVFLKERSELH